MPTKEPIIVFSHLRWGFVYQRPQHLLSRLAKERHIYFIEEPLPKLSKRAKLVRLEPEPGVSVFQPVLPVDGLPFGDEQLPYLAPLIGELVEKEKLGRYVAWLYTPMALPLARCLDPIAVVYDCMDALAAFQNAPPQLLNREAELLELAGVVFTGGPSLYRAKVGKHPNLHCFSSSVDTEHFAKAKRLDEADDQKKIPHPRLGFYGVIDERMDLELLDAVASERPEWHLVMVGPVVKIDPKSLPKRKNIHYIGQRDYELLPSYLAGWDVCLLPFALNESTRYISPTKTLEYMAAGLPIVSTPITDVEEPYGDIVFIARSASEFVAACEKALSATTAEQEHMMSAYTGVLAQTSWQSTAQAMDQLIDASIEKPHGNFHKPYNLLTPSASAVNVEN